MSFVSLGLVNVRRNLGRSALAIVSMAVASLVVTSLLSLAPSAHTAENLTQRFLLGGDIIVTRLQVVTSASDLDPAAAEPGSWGLDRLPLDAAGLLGEAVPWPWIYGYLAPGNSPGQSAASLLSDQDLASIAAALDGQAKVAGLEPLSYLPVLERVGDPAGGQQVQYVRSYLVGRDARADARVWGGYLGELVDGGTYLDGGDSPDLIAVCDNARQQRGYPAARAGTKLTVLVPSAAGGGPGAGPDVPVFDYSRTSPVTLDVVGTLRTVTATELTEGGPIDYYWGSGAILVPQATLDLLARQAGLERAPVAGVAVKATDLIQLDALTTAIRAAAAGFNVFSVREFAATLAWTGGVVPLSGELTGATITGTLVPRGLPLDLNLVFAVLAFTIAAMIVAANLLVLLIERRREISILRSLGARTGDIAIMVETEVLVLSLAGCVLGFWPIRLLATLTLVANRLSIGRIAALTFADFGLVCGIAIAMAAIFGLLPAIASTRTTCMEALRND